MRGFLAKLCRKNGIARRILSVALSVFMLSSVVQALPAGILTAHAAEGDTNVTLHFYNGNWNWTTPGLEYWSGSAEVSGATAADITYSAENVKPGWQLNADGDNWYSITLKGDFTGFQFVDLASPSERNTAGKGYDANMVQYNGETPTDLYFKETDSTWYLDSTYNTPMPEAAGVISEFDITIHWYDGTLNWGNANLYTWGNAGDGDWPGTAMTANASREGWYDITLTDRASNSITFICNGGGKQTVNLTHEADSATEEIWVYDPVINGEGKYTATISEEAPDIWNNPPSLEAEEATYLKLYVEIPSAWTWGQPAIWYQGTNVSVTSDGSTTVAGSQVPTWGENDIGYLMTKDGDTDWYYIYVKGDMTNLQIMDLSAPAGRVLNSAFSNYFSQYKEETAQSLYYKCIDDTWKWYTNQECTVELSAPAGMTLYDVTLHYYNQNGWENLNIYTWNPESQGTWPGKSFATNAVADTWYDVTLEDLESPNLEFKINNAGNGGSNMAETLVDGPNEFWIVGTTVYDEEPDESVLAKTYEVTINYHNRYDFENVYAYLTETDSWSKIKGFEAYGTFPGANTGFTAVNGHDGWYKITVTKNNDSAINAIFNNGETGEDKVQTGNLKINITGETTEVWVDGDLTQEEVFTEAPASWNNPTVSPFPTPASDSYVTDLMEVKIGSETYPLDVYYGGFFETVINLPAGTHTATLYKNGEATTQTASITLGAAADVSVCYINNGQEQFQAVKVSDYGTWSIAGGLTELGYGNWDQTATNTDMTYVGGGLYKVTLEFAALASNTPIEYKAVKNHAWGTEIGNENGGNVSVTIPAGSTSLTIYADLMQQKLYDNVRSAFTFSNASFAGLTTEVSLIGDVRGFGDSGKDWGTALDGWEFTPISDTLYRFDYEIPTAGNMHNYKIILNGNAWLADPNRTLATYEDNTRVIFLFDTTAGEVYDTVNHNDKVARLLSMTASPIDARVLDNGDGTVTFTTGATSGQEVVLYYADKEDVEANGTSAFKAVEMSTVIARKSSGTVTFGDGAIDIVYYYTIDGAKTLDDSNETIIIGGAEYLHYTRAAFGGRVVNMPGSFPGPSWDPASNQMTYLGDNLYSITFEDLAAATYEFKVAIGGSWSENYGANGALNGGNIQLSVPSLQDVTIYYSDTSHLTASSIDYVFADIDLEGTGIAAGTKLTDPGLTGIYSAEITVPAGTYNDWQLTYEGQTYDLVDFTLDAEKTVNVYMDIATMLYYHDAIDLPIETANIYFDSKDSDYKSVFGAVATGENVTFSIQTGTDVTGVSLVVKGVEKKAVTLEKDGAAIDGKQKWSATTSFSVIGENDYYFAITNGATMSIYCDDDEYYGTGKLTTLSDVLPYDLIVYKSGFETPDWMKNAVIYQIFPDRFADGDTSNNDAQRTARGAVNYEWITDWYTIPENPEQKDLVDQATYEARGAHWGDGEWSNEIYGGDLKGITENIDYLKALGVNVIYLNPVFSSISSHRYDACDYTVIDPVLGTMGDFTELVTIAEQNGMKVVLDGVFNHVSDDSIYFDRYYKFLGDEGLNTIGAYPYWAFVYDYMADYGVSQAVAESAAKNYFTTNYGVTDYSYTEWFEVYTEPMSDGNGGYVYDTIGWRTDRPVYGYQGWWGYDSMPIIKSTNGSEYQSGNWAEEIIYAQDGSSVTQYWISEGMDGWRLDVANEVSDETWQHFRQSVKSLNSDAVIIGEIWDDATKYILGDMYDSVMNYMFRNAVTDFAKGTDATTTMKEMEKLRERYPEEAFYAMMNLVGSHDTSRILSYLDGVDDDRNQKDLDSAFPTYAGTSDAAKQKQYLVAFLQFTYAGAPTIYYGDEIGMVGGDDPDDRRAFEWGKGNEELVTYYATLAAVRNTYSALRTGSVEAFDTGNTSVLGYVRRDNSDTIVVLANNSASAQSVTLDLTALDVEADKLVDVLASTEFTVNGTSATVNVPARRGVILVDDNAVETITVNTTALAPAFDPSYVIAERAELEGEIVGNEIIAEVPVIPPTTGGTGTAEPSPDTTTNTTTTTTTTKPGTTTDTDEDTDVEVEVETEAETKVPETVTEVTPVVDKELQEAVKEEAEKVLEDILNEEIAEDVLDEETLENVKKAQEDGEGIITEIIVETIDESTVDADVKDALEKALAGEIEGKEGATAKIAQYLDLSVLLKTTNGQELGTINKLSKDITFTIAVPEDLVKEGRVFVVLRMHEGETTVLETTMNPDGTISFKTDRFSTYALAYIDTPVVEDAEDEAVADDTAPTGSTTTTEDGGNFTVFIIIGIIIVIIAALVIVLLAMKGKKKE